MGSNALRAVMALLSVAVGLLACDRPRGGGAVRDVDPLLAEFEGSYPSEAIADGQLRTFDLVAAPTELPLLDGHTLRVWAYDGQVPGPTLRVRLGDTVRVRFTNRLPDETTIHWHGVRVPNPMDGVPHLTQAPVAPGETFVYEFTPKDAGTFWFHPHVRSSEQVERGLYGVLVVEDREPPRYSRDLVWVVDDWLLDETGQIFGEFNTRHDLAHDGRWGNVITVNGRTDQVLRVRPGERIRLRILNASNGRVVAPSFRGLDAQLIAVDGNYLRSPADPSGIELAPGNRIDVDLSFVQSVEGPFEVVDTFDARRPNRLATIAIEGELVPTPSFASPARAHVPRWLEALGRPEHHAFHLDARRGGPLGIEWTIDGRAFAGHGADHATALSLEEGRFYRLRFVNDSARLHPIHLHGMFFRLLARDGAPVDEPFFRDTVLVHGRESIDIGLVPADAGRWMMHCHILEHAEAGMMTTIEVRARGGA